MVTLLTSFNIENPIFLLFSESDQRLPQVSFLKESRGEELDEAMPT